MTWTKLSDDFSDDCWELADAAYRLHVDGLVWAMRKLTGGILAKDEMHRWAKHPDAAPELVTRGYWRDEGDRYIIRHHMGYQREPEKVLAQQEVNRLNGKRGGRPRGSDIQPPETDAVSDSLSDSASVPTDASAEQTDSLSDSKTEREWTGLDRSVTKRKQPGEGDSRARAHARAPGPTPRPPGSCAASTPTSAAATNHEPRFPIRRLRPSRLPLPARRHVPVLPPLAPDTHAPQQSYPIRSKTVRPKPSNTHGAPCQPSNTNRA
jgi:hypothetical protein